MAPSEELKTWREKTGRTVLSCAAEVGVAHPTWLDWESGRKSPRTENAFKLQKITKGTIKAATWGKAETAKRKARAAPPEEPVPDTERPVVLDASKGAA